MARLFQRLDAPKLTNPLSARKADAGRPYFNFSLGVESSMTGAGQLRILSLPTGQELAPWQLQPGCCGVSGPVPSATLDKRYC
jgi:hypothetical protein